MHVHLRPRMVVKQNYSLAFFGWSLQILSCKILPGESTKSFPKINGVLMPLTTCALTLILMGPSGVWKYKSILTYPEMDTFPMTWTRLTCCPCRSLMRVCISESDFCKIRVMSDLESIITLVRFLSRKLTVAGT